MAKSFAVLIARKRKVFMDFAIMLSDRVAVPGKKFLDSLRAELRDPKYCVDDK